MLLYGDSYESLTSKDSSYTDSYELQYDPQIKSISVMSELLYGDSYESLTSRDSTWIASYELQWNSPYSNVSITCV